MSPHDAETDTGNKIRKYSGRTGDNWNSWVPLFKSELIKNSKDGVRIISSKFPKPEQGTEEYQTWENANQAIYYVLCRNTTGAALNILLAHQATEDGLAAWEALRDKYSPSDEFAISELRTRFVRCSAPVSNIEELSERLDNIENLRNQLIAIGEDMPEQTAITCIQACLPDSFDGWKWSFNRSTPTPRLKDWYSDLRLQIRDKMNKRKYRGTNKEPRAEPTQNLDIDGEEAFMAQDQVTCSRRNIVCRRCNRYGHLDHECQQDKEQQPDQTLPSQSAKSQDS